jgi:protein SCO1
VKVHIAQGEDEMQTEVTTRPEPRKLLRVFGAMGRLVLGAAMTMPFACVLLASDMPDPHAAHRRAMAAPTTASATRVRVPDIGLRDRHGKAFALSSSRFEDRVVVIDFVFTRCKTICPSLTALMSSLESRLGTRMGIEVELVSVSLDPAHDSPQVLNDFAQRLNAGPHWWWLTGEPPRVDRVLTAFGLSPGEPENHPPMLLVGRPSTGEWLRWTGIPRAQDVLDRTVAMIEAGDGRTAVADTNKRTSR